MLNPFVKTPNFLLSKFINADKHHQQFVLLIFKAFMDPFTRSKYLILFIGVRQLKFKHIQGIHGPVRTLFRILNSR